MHQIPLTFRLFFALTKIAFIAFLTCGSRILLAMEVTPAPSQFPMESLIGINGKPFSTRDVLNKEMVTIVFYLSPECGACAEQTKAITSNMNQMKDVQFLFVTAYSQESTEAFLEDHNIQNYENIRFGYDANLTLQQHYQLQAVPSIYLYNSIGQLIQEWTGYTSVEVLEAAVDGKIKSDSSREKDLKEMWEKVEECPEPTEEDFSKLCWDVVENLEDEDTGVYNYILTLRRLACVPKGSSPENTNKLIREWWNIYAPNIKCDLEVLALKNQNILKYAVHLMRKQFITDLVEEYEVNIDYPDDDGKSVLKFCEEEIVALKAKVPVDNEHLKMLQISVTTSKKEKKE